MPQITSLTVQKKNKNRVNVFLDGAFAFGLDLETALRHGLKVGKKLSETEVMAILKESEFGLWYGRSLQLISRRPHSEYEIRMYFKKHEVGELLADKIIEKLKSHQFLDDHAFASWFIEQRLNFKPKGQRALTQELRQKGIDNEIIQEVFSQSTTDEAALVRQLVEKKMRLLSRYPPQVQKQKLIGFLSRRGFSWDTIQEALRK